MLLIGCGFFPCILDNYIISMVYILSAIDLLTFGFWFLSTNANETINCTFGTLLALGLILYICST